LAWRISTFEGVAMRGVIGRAAIAAATVLALVGLPTGVASAGAAPAVLAFQPAPYDYGHVAVGERPERVFTLANTGGRASSSLTVQVSGSTAFSVIADTCTGTSLGPGKTCTVTVRFTPTGVGAVTGELAAAGKNRAAAASAALTGAGRRLGSTGPGHLYWTSLSEGYGYVLTSMSLSDQTTTPVLTDLPGADLMTVDDTDLYWSSGVGGPLFSQTISALPLAAISSSPSVIPATPLITAQRDAVGVAVDGGHIYWADLIAGTISMGSLVRDPVTNGVTVTDKSFLFQGLGGPLGVAVDGSYIYWTTVGTESSTSGTIWKASLPSATQPSVGAPVALVTGQNNPSGLVVDGSTMYWANYGVNPGEGSINSFPLDGGATASRAILVDNLTSPYGIAVNSGNIYWTGFDITASQGTINRASINDNGATSLYTSGFDNFFGIAVGP
jgi:hypothetical protein